ncbi:MAG: peptidoglycan-binding domain-containing protein, partial [Acidimicrobiia bacterium]
MDTRIEETPVSADLNNETDDVVAGTHRTRRWLWIIPIVVVVAGAAVAYALLGNGSDAGGTDQVTLSFADVVQADLVQTDTFDGTLGTEDGDPVTSPISGVVTTTAEPGTTIEQGDVFLTVDDQPVVLLYGDLPAYRALAATGDSFSAIGNKTGVVTDVVAAGDTIVQGDVLYRVNGEPVVAMYGDVPAYRTLRDLSDNMTGDDVLQLEQNLVALGYDPDSLASVDDEFTSYTATMVERWQADLG